MNFINLTKVICFSSCVLYRNTLAFRKYSSDMECGKSYCGVGKDVIRGSYARFGGPESEFEPVNPTDSRHAVLYLVPRGGHNSDRLQPFIGLGDPGQWNNDFVRMPFSQENTQKIGNDYFQRWNIINEALSRVEKRQIRNINDLARVIFEYNPKYQSDWDFRALHALCDHFTDDEKHLFFESTLPAIAKLALKLPELIRSPLPLLKQHSSRSVSMTQEQIASLLANAFFCTFPWRNSKSTRGSMYKSYPNINFWRLFNASTENADVLEKLKCILNYFRRVSPDITPRSKLPKGVVTFSRRSVQKEDMPKWWNSNARIGDVKLNVDPLVGIEYQDGLIQLDFANKYLGGGVLGRGSVQEEIRFAVCPELMVSMLFVESMESNEAVMIIGAERYNKYIGYSRSFTWMGDYQDDTSYDSSMRRKVAVLAIDALPFKNKSDQYRPDNLKRELNKAYVGFSFYTGNHRSGFHFPGVATGNWGCGAFGGSPQLKSLIQIMACAEARRHIAYITFGDWDFSEELNEMYNCLASKGDTVAQLYEYILQYRGGEKELYRYLFDKLGERQWYENFEVRRAERQQNYGNNRNRRSVEEQSDPTTCQPQSKL